MKNKKFGFTIFLTHEPKNQSRFFHFLPSPQHFPQSEIRQRIEGSLKLKPSSFDCAFYLTLPWERSLLLQKPRLLFCDLFETFLECLFSNVSHINRGAIVDFISFFVVTLISLCLVPEPWRPTVLWYSWSSLWPFLFPSVVSTVEASTMVWDMRYENSYFPTTNIRVQIQVFLVLF